MIYKYNKKKEESKKLSPKDQTNIRHINTKNALYYSKKCIHLPNYLFQCYMFPPLLCKSNDFKSVTRRKKK